MELRTELVKSEACDDNSDGRIALGYHTEHLPCYSPVKRPPHSMLAFLSLAAIIAVWCAAPVSVERLAVGQCSFEARKRISRSL